MWMSPTRPAQQVSLMMVLVMTTALWSPVTHSSSSSSGSSGESAELPTEPKYLFSKSSPAALRLEVVAVLPDASNISLGFSKALSRALNSLDEEDYGESRNITWRVKNFVIVNTTEGPETGPSRKGVKKYLSTNITFSPSLIPRFCDFLTRTKAVAMVNLIGDVGGERVLSLLSTATALPLIGSSQFENPLQTLHKDKDDFYISLSTSVRQVAHALGHLLIYCHWHTFTVLFDDSPSVASTQMIWEEELSQMMASPRFYQQPPPAFNATPSDPDFYDYDQTGRSSSSYGVSGLDYEKEGGNDDDLETSPVLNPNFITIKNRQLNGALRALSHLTKATQGVVVLLCSDRSLVQVFRAAQKLRLLYGDYVFILVGPHAEFEVIPEWVPSGVLALRSPRRAQLGKYTTKRTGKLLASALHSVKNVRLREGRRPASSAALTFSSLVASQSSPRHDAHPPSTPQLHSKTRSTTRTVQDLLNTLPNVSCSKSSVTRKYVSQILTREMRNQMEEASANQPPHRVRPREPDGSSLTFDILNLVNSEVMDMEGRVRREWISVGNVSVAESPSVQLRTIQWPGGGIFGPGDRPTKTYRIVTITAPPFVMDAEADDNKTCVKGLPCLKVNTTNKDELAVIFAEHDRGKYGGGSYQLACCDGLAMDLLISISRELKFEIDLYLVPDGYFGSRSSAGTWNGIMNVLVSGSAHMSFAPFSVTSIRATAVDFSTPFFFSGVGFLGRSKNQDVPLMAFLAPFSFELWAAIFLTLNMTALAVALFEWLSPFGLNPWGRQRTKNFSMASALWVVWGRLFSHLVQYKAPKSWPNKFLINVWGGFSVIFVASYTANIAALFAGKFFQRGVDFHDRSLLSQRVAVVKHSATDFYINRENQQLWEHIQTFPVHGFQQGVEMLKNQTLDLLVGDGPLLDYYRGADSTCNLIDVSNQDKIGDDTYAVAMTKGFPLKESISTLIAKYIGNGYMDYLQGKWYGQLECFRRRSEFVGARALGVDSVAGMIIMLGVGTLVGLLILLLELMVYKYALPYFRRQPKGTIWRSPNIMFFSQKLYRFINCVELVSPHHAAKELVNTLRHGQITSLFQKSVKRKEHEQRRRRKSKAQFFEMIQEVRRVQKHERQQSVQREDSTESETRLSTPPIYSIHARLESNKQTPKLVRVLGADVDLSTQRHSITSPILEVPEEPGPPAPVAPEGLYRRRETGPAHSKKSPLPSTSSKRKRLKKILKVGVTDPLHSYDPLQPSSSSTVKHKAVEFDLADEDEDDNEENDEEEDLAHSAGEEDELGTSALNNVNLRNLSKRQVISLWRTSELDLRRQLAILVRERNELKLKLKERSGPERPP